MASEKAFENRVKQFLKEQGCWFVKYWSGLSASGQKFTRDGIPDILCCCNGYFLGIEIKAPKGKPSPLQIHNLKKIDESGGYGILLYPKDFEVFKILIQKINGDIFGVSLDYKELKERWDKSDG